MKILKGTAYCHFYLDIDGLIVDLLSVQIDSSELNEDHGVHNLFQVLIKDHMINLNSILLLEKNLKVMGFSTIEGLVRIDLKDFEVI